MAGTDSTSHTLQKTANMEAIHDLKSTEQSQLLDIIDQLRQHNVDADIDIPQIVVCGDTSSGKSSVLEAISQMRFPVGHKAVTKFPTEIVLRHSQRESMSVKLIPAHDRPIAERDEILDYEFETDVTDHRRLDRVVPEVAQFLQEIEQTGADFWSDTLHAEVCGPTLPHLTLVDLPGLIHFSRSQHGLEEDGESQRRIQEMTLSHLKNPRAVVLAVVSAINDTQNQEILSLVKKANAQDRTLGIITKPDRVSSAADEQQSLLTLARNEEVCLGLGWHVLRNLSHDEAETLRGERDEIEEKFFSSALWAGQDREILGISTLRKKLSRCLFDCIKRDLPTLLEEMQRQTAQCQTTLDQLGEGRETPREQREYLGKIVQHFQRLTEAALDGQYSRSEFQAFDGLYSAKRLRDVITNHGQSFAKMLRKSGRQYSIIASNEPYKGYTSSENTLISIRLTS